MTDGPPPVVLDVDGTLTRPEGGLDPRTIDALRNWPKTVVIATGKAFPYPVALCHFAGIPENVVAENGGVVHAAGEVAYTGDPEAARAVASEYVEAGYSLGWPPSDLVNRWRETEVAVSRDAPLAPLQALADDHGQEVVDTGYAYHVKSPEMSKGRGLELVADLLGLTLDDAVMVGDSINDVSGFERVGRSYAVANADDDALAAADVVLEEGYADGTLGLLNRLRSR